MPSPIEFAHLQIPLNEVVKATNKFANENLIGQGGFGKVYRGTLSWMGQSIDVAARKLHHDYGQGDIEFWTEIMMLASLNSENVVSIVGFCDENDEKIIVNKYEAKRSLDKYIKSPTLTWMQRLQISVDVAHALRYIHYDDGHDFSVIHRNIKSSKILLDDNWKPKLCGFQTSLKSTKARRDRIFLAEVIGTIGYVDPMYEKTGFVTHKSDVYSLGVVLFEVMCGRRAFGECVDKDLSESTLPSKDHKSSRATIITDAIKKW
ncbi:kinase RLK-Pelle-CrRLK1L-1 family protein [Tanacetum coccineum]